MPAFSRYGASEHKRLGIYIHVPFCLSKCAYCDFNSSVCNDPERIRKYIDAVIAHMDSYSEAAASYEPDTVFIGGGTPTSIPPAELYRLVKAVKKIFNLTETAEFTVEMNPATASKRVLSKLRKLGVNRLSMGLQTADENELKALSRIHTRKDFFRSYRMAREAGFENINVDLMFGIPFQTFESLMHTIRYVASLGPEHISLYDLKIEPGTAFHSNYEDIKAYLPEEETEYDMYLASVNLLRDLGYHQYEISNFSRPGRRCVHNLKYWNCDEYLGFGVSAHSYFNGNRFSIIPDVDSYISSFFDPASKVVITENVESVEERERLGEYIMLRLRLTDGIESREFSRRFGYSFEQLYGEKLVPYIRGGYMTASNGTFALTPAGMFVSNYIISDILEFEDFGKYYFGS